MPTLVLDHRPLTRLRQEGGDIGLSRLVLALAEAAQPGAEVVAALRVDQAKLEKPFARDLRVEFEALGKVAVAATNSSGGLVMESKADIRRRVAAIIAAMHIPTWVKTRLIPIYEAHYKKMAEAAAKTLNRFDLGVSLRSEIERDILRMGGKRVGLLDIPGDTKEAIFRAIDEGRELGLNPKATAKLVEDWVPRGRFVNAGSRYRSQLIARSEVLHGQRKATIQLYKTSPVVKSLVAFDGDSDPTCAARNGRVFNCEEADLEADNEHPNGTLAFGPVT